VSERIINFSAGPAILPEEVLEEAREAIWNLDGTGIGVLEHSHRGKPFERVMASAVDGCRAVAGIPDDYQVLFVQGGATMQFAMVAANLMPEGGAADYLDTGSWSKKAIAEAKLYGSVHVAASSKDANYNYIPAADAVRASDAPAYLHFTSNNTIFGTQWQSEPESATGAPLVCDASSDLFSRPIDVSKYGLIYAGAQKNLGPAGAALVILREDLATGAPRELPALLRYATYAENNSLYNTPPSFSIFVMSRVFQWILREGGLEAIQKRNEAKAGLLYSLLDASDFYAGTAATDSRSRMNVTFRTPSEELDALFVDAATREGLDGLKGHRSVGGMRASIYNAFPESGCRALASFMADFAAKHG